MNEYEMILAHGERCDGDLVIRKIAGGYHIGCGECEWWDEWLLAEEDG